MGKRVREEREPTSDGPSGKKPKLGKAQEISTKSSIKKSKKPPQHRSSMSPTRTEQHKASLGSTEVVRKSNELCAPEKSMQAKLSDETKDHSRQPRKSRFIVFVGNLPYTATTETIAEHFSKIHPDSIRLITERPGSTPAHKHAGKGGRPPKGPKSKGFAFLEFTAFDRMTTCLKLYHHSTFEDGKGPARKINCELTAGGGGKGKARAEKVKAKNTKLDEERRQDRISRHAKQDENGDRDGVSEGPIRSSAVHPSRRTRVPNA